ncbi:hypothetical protein B0H13DRAFT_2265790 [Mycena leptocephala]|nr:hypothetical protein B0H13DRAFT_2265790 [Mycena leptocephala]
MSVACGSRKNRKVRRGMEVQAAENGLKNIGIGTCGVRYEDIAPKSIPAGGELHEYKKSQHVEGGGTQEGAVKGRTHKRVRAFDERKIKAELWISACLDSSGGWRLAKIVHESGYYRCHAVSLTKIVDDAKPFPTSSSRFNVFAKLIVCRPGTATREPCYSKLDIPILYYGWQGEKDWQGQAAAAKTVERMYKIQFTTLGAIINSYCIAIWLYSADKQLSEMGDETENHV